MTPKQRIAALAGVGLLGVGYLVAESQTVQSSASERPIKRVQVAAVEPAAEHRQLGFSGVTRARQRARLSFTLGARMVARPVEVGERVRRGQVVARLDDSELRNAVANARGQKAELLARGAQAQRELQRVERLVSAKAATEEELERARADVEIVTASGRALDARLSEAERLLAETALRAPFGGTVTEVLAEPGEFVGPGQAVLHLSGDGDLELEVEVPESVVARLSVGDEVGVRVPSLGPDDFAGRIESVGRAAAGAGQLFPVLVHLPDSARLVIGATAEVRLRLSSNGALAVPVEAVVNPGGRRPSVFVLADGRVRRVAVEVGSLVAGRVVVRGALDAGDQVVVGGQRGLLDGESVEVVR